MKFSDRFGYTQPQIELQYDNINRDLLNSLWNTFVDDFFYCLSSYSKSGKSGRVKASIIIWKYFFKNQLDLIPHYRGARENVYASGVLDYIRKRFFEFNWYEIYNFIEFICELNNQFNTRFVSECNKILKRELSGYRIIDNKIVQITSEEEIKEIKDALYKTQDKFQPVNIHLKAALEELSKKTSPVYRNSIKESISAVEALSKIVTGDPKATLGKALKIIESKHGLHKSLKSSFSNLYGYTSDSGGIRHALVQTDKEIGFEEAKFMYISCVAFINYILSLI